MPTCLASVLTSPAASTSSSVKKMASFFGLDFRASVREINDLIGEPLGNIYDEIDGPSPVGDDETLEACFLGMAMGWNWALYFCNEALSDAMRAVLRCVGLPDILLGDRQQPPLFSKKSPLMAPYVDNGNIIAADFDQGKRCFDLLVGELRRRGLVLRDLVEGSSHLIF